MSRSQGNPERSCHKKYHLKYRSSSTQCSKVINKVNVNHIGETPMSRSQGKQLWFPRKKYSLEISKL